MNASIKVLLKSTPAYSVLVRLRKNEEVRDWCKRGRPLPPPPSYKQGVIKNYARRFRIRTFIETGTLHGDMVAASMNLFDSLYSIELDEQLFANARERFDGCRGITLIQGDSGTELPNLLRSLRGRCLFWLDGHYSGEGTARGFEDTPILRELRAILNHPCHEHVVLIDDARCFDGHNGYPMISEIKSLVSRVRPDWHIEVEHDIIRLHLPTMS